ncbi:MAG: hypothetical protein RMI79_03920 [Nitrososphaerota archaeon]|nr:hypothetical protein [Nitrososphaerota archaeon]
MMQKAFVQDIKKESVEDRLVHEIIEIMGMINMVENRAHIAEYSQNASKFETLLQTLRHEMVKRAVLLASKHGLKIRLPMTYPLNNGGEKLRETSYDDFSRLEEELNKAYRFARDMLDNLNRLV